MYKNLKMFLIISIFTLLCIVGTSSVNAATIEFTNCSGVTLTDAFVDAASASNASFFGKTTEAIYLSNDDNKVLYCMEKGRPLLLTDGSKPTASFDQTSISSGTAKWIARVIAYGYPVRQSGHSISDCPSERIATQLLVQLISRQGENGAWKNYSESKFESFMTSGSSKRDAVVKHMVNIRDKALAVDTKPSFDGKTVSLKYNSTTHKWTGSITDANGVLGNWTMQNSSDISVSVSGNVVTLTASDDNVKSGNITFSRQVPEGNLYYSNYNSTYQKTTYYVSGSAKTVSVTLNYNLEAIGKGIVRLHKIDKYTGKNMQGATFGIYSDSECKIQAVNYLGNKLEPKQTNKSGELVWNNLYYPLKENDPRTYYVKETIPIGGYAFDNEQLDKLGAKNACIPVTLKPQVNGSEIEKNAEEVQAIYNIPYGNVTILKQDEETGKVIEGVEFELRKNNSKKEPAVDIDGNIVKNVVTNKNGIAEFEKIPYGDYILIEVKANDWYKVLEKPLEFTLNKDNDALKYEAAGTEALPDENETLLPLEKYRLGDPTDDGKINADDIKIVEQIISGEIEEKGLEWYASDVNKDNAVNEQDKELIQKYIDGDQSVFEGLKEEEIPGQIKKRVTLSITNKPIDLKISKQAITNAKELKGATIVIKNAKGEVFLKYVSNGKVKEFPIPIGDYTLIETVAPKGYQTLKTEVKFRVLSNGNVKMVSAKSNMYKLEKSKEDKDTDLDHLIIYNNLKKIKVPNTGSVIAISSIVGGVLLIGGGAFVIYRRYKIN